MTTFAPVATCWCSHEVSQHVWVAANKVPLCLDCAHEDALGIVRWHRFMRKVM